jgi:succinate dehydrogenase/fumarate reductase cytochrome b subunit
MKIRSKIQSITSGMVSLFLFTLAYSASALTLDKAKTAVGKNISTDSSLITTAMTVITWILVATGAAAVLMLIIGGFRYITSAGNEKQADAAKETLTNAIMGLVFVLLAYVIASTINMVFLSSCNSGVPLGNSYGPCQ